MLRWTKALPARNLAHFASRRKHAVKKRDTRNVCACCVSNYSTAPNSSPEDAEIGTQLDSENHAAEPVANQDPGFEKEWAHLYSEKAEYPPMVPPSYEKHSIAADKQEKEDIKQFVRNLETVKEKVEYVNPYERPWNKLEKRWHRDFFPRLYPQRKAYRVHAAPHSYNLLDYYKFITKTRTVQGFPDGYYDSTVSSEHLNQLTSAVSERWKESWLRSDSMQTMDALDDSVVVDTLINDLTTIASQICAVDFPHLRDAEVTKQVRNETFWVRGGFHTLYDQELFRDPVKHHKIPKLQGDDRRIKGELAFCFREQHNLQIRTQLPLPQVCENDMRGLGEAGAMELYPPRTVGLHPEGEPLWMAPGYELDQGANCEFGHLTVTDCSKVLTRVDWWGCDGEEREQEILNCLTAMSVSSAFSWLNGQAHALGFNQYDDITFPLVSQVVLSNGSEWFFAVYQLNSIDITKHYEEQLKPTNVCWVEGPFTLDRPATQASNTVWAEDIVTRFLKFLLKTPEQRSIDMKPYVKAVSPVEHYHIDRHYQRRPKVRRRNPIPKFPYNLKFK